jgi:hypothetical protein
MAARPALDFFRACDRLTGQSFFKEERVTTTATMGNRRIGIDIDIANDIDIGDLLTYMGYNGDKPASEKLHETARRMRERCLDLVKPRSAYSLYETVEADGDAVRIGGAEFRGKILSTVLDGSVMAAVCVCTVGRDIDDEVERLNSGGNAVSALVLDTMGIVALMRVRISFLNELYEREARPRGFSTTPPYGPGQCGWEIGEQRELFTLVDADSAGIRLTESCLMIPKKSVSGIVGLGPKGKVFNNIPCDVCDRADCRGRKMMEMFGGRDGA